MESNLSCRDFVEFLADYVAGRLSAAELARFSDHLARCPACVSYTHSYRQAVGLSRSALLCPDDQVPGDVPEALVRAILDAREETT